MSSSAEEAAAVRGTPAGTVDVEADLDELFVQVRALRELVAEGNPSPEDGDVYDFSIRWGAMMSGRLPRIVHYLHRDQLAPRDRRRFDRLTAEFADLAGWIQRLRLAPVPSAAQPSGRTPPGPDPDALSVAAAVQPPVAPGSSAVSSPDSGHS